MASAEDMIDEILAAVKTGDVTHVPRGVEFRRSGKDARMLIGAVNKDLVKGGLPDEYLVASGSDQAQVWVYRYWKWQEDRVRYIAYGNGKDGGVTERQLSNTTVAKMELIDERLSYFSIFNSAAGKKLYPKEQDRKRAHEKWMVFVLDTKAPVVSEVDSDAPPEDVADQEDQQEEIEKDGCPWRKDHEFEEEGIKAEGPSASPRKLF
ncbi:hypothetical protein TI39_contig621g00001 [Zymoseptoria brevis]|uniref:Uncharacterized protein n=1 Tax=Zymoseptoria brevis TaxID=1047168 RepID=A0A0F4GJZ5_9PEZI|nr:hypothetical protein TI39_contig621g00001 [Zymoseptoria brevis]